jgi:phage terminase large subunit-like protein
LEYSRRRLNGWDPEHPNKVWHTRGERNIAWIETYCCIPEGPDVGKRVLLRPWQRKIILGIYDNVVLTRRAIITVGKKNSKSTMAAFLLLLHLCGLEAKMNGQLYSTAQSREQAALIFALAAKIVRMTLLSRFVGVRETAKKLTCPARGTEYRALSAEASTAHGVSPTFIVHDELGQVIGPRSDLYEALETSTMAQEDPLSIVISTQAPSDQDLLSILIDDSLKMKDPRTVLFLYTSDPKADPFAEETIKQANPAFGDFQNRAEILGMAEEARRMPSREAGYRNLNLNQRVEIHNPYISKSVWDSCGSPVERLDGLEVFGGLDLSETNDLTALVLVGLYKGVWQVHPRFWLPEEGLMERSRKDKVTYDLWHQQGFLDTTPGNCVEYEFVADHLRGVFDAFDVRKIAFDRWNFKHLRPWLEKVGFSEDEITNKFVEFGQGFQSMSPALRDLDTAFLNHKLAHGNHPVLQFCAANSVVRRDPSGNRKLDKSKSRGRIDGMIALTMAMAMAATSSPEPVPTYQMLIF